MDQAISTQVVFYQELEGTVPLLRNPLRSHAAGHDTGDPPPTVGHRSTFCASHMLGCAPWRKIASWWNGDNGHPFREPVSHGEKDRSDRGMEGAQASDGASSGDMGLALIDQRGLGASQAYFTAYSTNKPMGPLGGFVFGEYL